MRSQFMKIRGFTLLEVMFALALLVGLLLVSSWSFFSLIQKNERETLINNIKTAVQYSKIQAIHLGHPIYLIPLGSNENWAKGIVLAQFDQKSNKIELIHQWHWNSNSWNINWKGVDSNNRIIISNIPYRAMSNGKFILDNRRTNERVVVTLNRLGRVKVGNLINAKSKIK
ncbi:TPA: prepilin-type N-terminal cleavage/methylation domain-containing protein [Legionella pneumophila]|nr:prepilin-type N-terminal cleavage/methylation domain-containing protein [Legionella pneumophila subsp. fraseri]HAT1772949.1 prepilin-type N-terminal cleavage/methylation domain-containing protein [Legionella pneumophila]MDX1847112.1 prepilin-type N-terminal cleavage/methylation domain-containing protein [Legionella pneumophila subsp. fraseri]HAT2127791.1 prepilin-type N-terminal cleavage/methylation domain-containing protein [Legionella pneumophila]HAT2136852.1 prepilin-type N-terminal cleav